MNDRKPFKHGEEGTHYACQAQVNKYGGKVKCCGCTGHDCDKERIVTTTQTKTQASVSIGAGLLMRIGFYLTMGVVMAIGVILLLSKLIDFIIDFIGKML